MQRTDGCGTLSTKGSGLKFPTAKPSPVVSNNEDYLSTYHPYLLERRKVETPFGIGVCRRDAFRAVDESQESNAQSKKCTTTSCSINPHQRKSNPSRLNIVAGTCGRSYAVRRRVPDCCLIPSVKEVKRSPDTPCFEGDPTQSLHKKDAIKPQSWACGLNTTDKRNSTTKVGLCKPGIAARVTTDDTPTSMCIPKHITSVYVEACHSKNDHHRNEVACQLKVSSGTKAAAPGSMKAQSLVTKAQTCMIKPCLRPSYDQKDIGQKRAPTQCYPIKCRATTYVQPSKSCCCSYPNFGDNFYCVTGTTKATGSTSDGTNEKRLKIGSSVRVLANQDVCQPSFSGGQPRFITAVVTYITMDGRYKVGTTQGFIGRLFAREELQLMEKRKLNPSDVPPRSITVREASSTSYASRD